MKTLDEVIKRIEIYKNIFDKNGCFECHYHEDDCIDSCFLENVLHYLNTIETTENLYHDAVNKLSKWEEEDWKDRCLPLTWDELKQMEGKPVWIEFLNDEGEWNGEWCLVESSNNLICEILRCKMSWFGLRKITLGKTWQAYRKERT